MDSLVFVKVEFYSGMLLFWKPSEKQLGFKIYPHRERS